MNKLRRCRRLGVGRRVTVRLEGSRYKMQRKYSAASSSAPLGYVSPRHTVHRLPSLRFIRRIIEIDRDLKMTIVVCDSTPSSRASCVPPLHPTRRYANALVTSYETPCTRRVPSSKRRELGRFALSASSQWFASQRGDHPGARTKTRESRPGPHRKHHHPVNSHSTAEKTKTERAQSWKCVGRCDARNQTRGCGPEALQRRIRHIRHIRGLALGSVHFR